jgi:hypothetical protein
MNSKDLILLKKTAAKISLDRGGINLSEYNLIMKKIEEVEQEMEYAQKLKQYKINEAKQRIISRNIVST